MVTMFGMDIAVALGGALFVESVWSLPGLGNIALQSLSSHDLPTTGGGPVHLPVSDHRALVAELDLADRGA